MRLGRRRLCLDSTRCRILRFVGFYFVSWRIRTTSFTIYASIVCTIPLEIRSVYADKVTREAGAIVLKVAYGYTIEPHGHDPLVDLADEAMATFGLAILPGTWAVDFIPICTWMGVTFLGDAGVDLSISETYTYMVSGGSVCTNGQAVPKECCGFQ